MSDDRLQVYEAPGITVTFDASLCRHSGHCVRHLPAVFDVHRKRWIRPEGAAADDVARVVEGCPSGALQYRWPEAQPDGGAGR